MSRSSGAARRQPFASLSKPARIVAVLGVGFVLAACASLFDQPDKIIKGAGKPVPASVSGGSAAAAISSYRRSNGLSSVTVDSRLTAIAARHSQAMAKADKMSHRVRGEPAFSKRLAAGGYNAAIAVENVGAGQRNFNEVFDMWKASPGHKANLLKKGVTQMGIAVSFNGNSKYGNFWTLVMAAPDTRQSAALIVHIPIIR